MQLPCAHLSPSSKKKKRKRKNCPKKVSYILENESCSYLSGNENPEKI